MENVEKFCKLHGIIALITGVLTGIGIGLILQIPDRYGIYFLLSGAVISVSYNLFKEQITEKQPKNLGK